MFRIDRLVAIATLLCIGLSTHPHAARAETFNTCAGFIDTLPTTISTQGVWCLRHDLATNVSSGAAITIAANNVTIDCNDFKVGGLAAGAATQTAGIRSTGRQNATIRHCNLRGFLKGIDIYAGAGHLVEDNRLDNSTYAGIMVQADTSVIQRNRVFDTGGNPIYEEFSSCPNDPNCGNAFSFGVAGQTFGIFANGADVIDNVVDGLFVDAAGYQGVRGIYTRLLGGTIHGNRIRNLQVGAQVTNCTAIGVSTTFFNQVADNVTATSNLPATCSLQFGILASQATCSNNASSGFSGADICGS